MLPEEAGSGRKRRVWKSPAPQVLSRKNGSPKEILVHPKSCEGLSLAALSRQFVRADTGQVDDLKGLAGPWKDVDVEKWIDRERDSW